jgi:hypothetical protein
MKLTLRFKVDAKKLVTMAKAIVEQAEQAPEDKRIDFACNALAGALEQCITVEGETRDA